MYARSLKLKSANEWQAWTTSVARPANMPANPPRTYQHAAWQGYGHWQGVARLPSMPPAPGRPTGTGVNQARIPSVYALNTCYSLCTGCVLLTRANSSISAMRPPYYTFPDEIGMLGVVYGSSWWRGCNLAGLVEIARAVGIRYDHHPLPHVRVPSQPDGHQAAQSPASITYQCGCIIKTWTLGIKLKCGGWARRELRQRLMPAC